MNRNWLITILGLSFGLLAILKTHEVNTLIPFLHHEGYVKLENFSKARGQVNPEQQELLDLWESILTGKSGPLSKLTRKTYQDLGLKHVFTPSGFHLTAVLSPFLKLSSSAQFHLGLLSVLGLLLYFVPGMGAMKRMILIKGSQRLTDTRSGLLIALFLDTLFGTFQSSPVSFSYSLLFLGIIYSGVRGPGLVFWFFVGQLIISHFQMVLISPLLLLWSPVLNFMFTLAMPILFVLALPLWNWQLNVGILVLELIQQTIRIASNSLIYFPMWEIHLGTIGLVYFFVFRKKILFWLLALLLSNSLNLDLEKNPSSASKEYRPLGSVVKIKNQVAYFTDGKCRFRLIRGYLWESCQPKKIRK